MCWHLIHCHKFNVCVWCRLPRCQGRTNVYNNISELSFFSVFLCFSVETDRSNFEEHSRTRCEEQRLGGAAVGLVQTINARVRFAIIFYLWFLLWWSRSIIFYRCCSLIVRLWNVWHSCLIMLYYAFSSPGCQQEWACVRLWMIYPLLHFPS